MVREKVRIRFRKEGPLRFVGHQDLLRCWSRLTRRADLPVRMGEGFRPRPRLSSPLSLPLGMDGWEEILELELVESLSALEVRSRLEDQCVDGLTIVSVSVHSTKERTRVVAIEYVCPLPETVRLEEVLRRRDELLAADRLVVERRSPGKPTRTKDIRPLVLTVDVEPSEVRLRLQVTAEGAPRPWEVLEALGLESLRELGVTPARSRVELEPNSR